MEDGYPTEEELDYIKNYDLIQGNVKELLDYIEERWWMSDWGFHLTGKRVLRLQLSTGGWSGNESIIDALQSNFVFWSMYWRKTVRGGHY